MATRIPLWKKLNISSLMVGAGCVLAGTASASLHGNLEIFPATLCLVFAAFAQLAANMANRHHDEVNFLGRIIDMKLSTEPQPTDTWMLKECAVSMFLLSIMVGLAIMTMAGWWVLPIGIFIIVAGWLSCNGATPLMHTPFSPFLAFVMFGPVCVITTSLTQSQHEATHSFGWYDMAPAIYVSIVAGLLATNATLVYNYSDYYSHLRNSRVSLATELGRKGTRVVFLTISILALAMAVWACLALNLNLAGLDMLPPALTFIINIYIWIQMRRLPRYKLSGLRTVANLNVLLLGLLAMIIFLITGTPDDSVKTYFGN